MPNPTLKANKFRLLLDVSNPSIGPATLVLPSGAELEFDLMVYDRTTGIFSDNTTIKDWSNINSVILALQSTNDPHNGVTYWAAQTANADINGDCMEANWNNGTDAQMSFTIPSGINNAAAVAKSQPFWICIYAVTTDAPNNYILLAAFQVSLFDSGIPLALGKWSLLGPDNLIHEITVGVGDADQLMLVVNQDGTAGPGISAPFIQAPDGTYHLPTLVKQANGSLTITLA